MKITTSQNLAQHWDLLRTSGGAAALKFLFGHFYDELFAYALKLTTDHSTAKDAIQNTFADLWQYRANLSPEVQVRPYLLRSVRNHSLKLLKKKSQLIELDEAACQITFEPEELLVNDGSETQKQRLVAALNSLSPRQREILYLKFYKDLSYIEIAKVLDLQYQSVVNHAHKAMLKLRHCDSLKFF